MQEEQVLLESRRSSHSEASPSFDAEAAAAAAMAAETAGEEQTGLLGLEAAVEHVVEVGIDAGLDLIDAGQPSLLLIVYRVMSIVSEDNALGVMQSTMQGSSTTVVLCCLHEFPHRTHCLSWCEACGGSWN